MSSDLLPWTEKYRPRALHEVIRHKEIIETLKSYVHAKNMPNLLFAGPPGIGKTTATLALARDLLGEDFRTSLLELNASDERGIDVVRGKIKDFARSSSIANVPFKLVFLDEADSLTSDAQSALRRTMELYVSATRFILGANYSSKIIAPIQSRCSVFRFRPLSEVEIEEMILRIAKEEGLKVDKEAMDALKYVSEGDMRRAINALQGAALSGKHVTAEIVHRLSSRAKPVEIRQMIDLAIGGSFLEARKKLDSLMISYGMSGEDVMMQVYREIPLLNIPEKNKVFLIDRLGEYNFRLVEGASERIQLEAMLAQFTLAK